MQSTIQVKSHLRTDAVNAPLDANPALERELRRRVEGEVRFDPGSQALYATDSSNYRQVPIGVVIPRTIEDVIATVAVCREHGAPITSRGGGTSLAGQCCNASVVIDFSKYLNRVIEIDPVARRARVQPGCVLDDLRREAQKHGLTFGPDPSTHNHNTLGGMIGNDSCGVHSVMAEFYGPGARTAEQVEELELLTYEGHRLRVGPTSEAELERIIRDGGPEGEIYARLRDLRDRYGDLVRERYPHIPRRVSGYNLSYLLPENGFHVARALVGSEGTCITVLEATLTLIPNPKARTLVVLGYPSVYDAGDDIPTIRSFRPIGCEGFDQFLVQDMVKKGIHPADVKLLPPGNGWLMVEFPGESVEDAQARAREAMAELKKRPNPPSMKLIESAEVAHQLWRVREAGLGATARVAGEPDTWPGWEDSAVPPERVGDYLRALRQLFDEFGYEASLYGHLGQGCVHCRISFDLTSAQGIAHFTHFMRDAAELVVSFGGSLSGEHGDGQARAAVLPIMFGPELVEAFREFKRIWDPQWKMNPGKVVDPYPIDMNLRLGTEYRPAQPATHFHFPRDDGSMARAVLRCVGVGQCRREDGGTMCPSYMVTREEMHSTRGRSRLLFEMLQGEVLRDGWRDERVKEALDLCLACKGCRHDCPMHVDMASYKAEFLSHYYDGRLRPRHAYSMGLIYWWARLASLAPGLVNLATQTPGVRALVKAAGGISPHRRVPVFARETLKAWFARREPRNVGAAPVILWPDTFNNHFYPEVGRAAVEVLEAAGYRVEVPRASLCCGRPLYDFGMLDLARHQLAQILDVLRPEIEAGVPVVGLEPSCVSVFRDELLNLFPNDEDARRLSEQTFLLSDFLAERAEGYEPPRVRARAVVHGHCHHKTVLGMAAEEKLLSRMGLECDVLDSGCCGMAGSFGFEADHYDVSVACGERVLLPAVRGAAPETLVVTDGFSCRQQIEQLTGRRPLHVAEVLRMGLEATSATAGGRAAGASGPPAGARDTDAARRRSGGEVAATDGPRPRRAARAAALGAAVAGGFLLGWSLSAWTGR